jgi:hypothetical protein
MRRIVLMPAVLFGPTKPAESVATSVRVVPLPRKTSSWNVADGSGWRVLHEVITPDRLAVALGIVATLD